MTLTLEDYLATHPVDRAAVDEEKARLLAEVRAYRLKEIRQSAGLTQQEVADRIGVSQKQVSKIERGDLDSARVGTVRKYLEAIGGGLSLEYVAGDHRLAVA